MFELFPDQPVYEFPTILNVAYAMLWATVLSMVIGVTHKLTFTRKVYPNNFFQALILGSIVTALVMMAIGDSLARGLGVFGAMAIIRFRTLISDPRDVLFLFASLSIGLAIGIFGFTIAFVGTFVFCGIAFALYFSPFRSSTSKMQMNFTLLNAEELNSVLAVAERYCDEIVQLNVTSSTNKEGLTTYKYQYHIRLNKNSSSDVLLKEILDLEKATQVKIALEEDIKW